MDEDGTKEGRELIGGRKINELEAEANEKIEVDVKYYECISSERSIEYMKIGHCHSCIADFGFVCFHLEMLFLINTCKNQLVQKHFFRF